MRKRIFLLAALLAIAISSLAEAASIEEPAYYCETKLEDSSVCESPVGSPPWKPLPSVGKTPTFQSGTDYVWYAVRIGGGDPDKKSLLFSTTSEAVSVSFDGDEIYSYGNMGDALGNNGSRWHFVPLPINDDGRHWLVMKLYSPVSSRVGTIDWIYLDSEDAQGQRIFLSDMLNVTTLSVAIGMLVIMYLFMKESHVNKGICYSSVAFLLSFVLWIAATINMKYLIVSDGSFWWCFRGCLIYILAMLANSVLWSVLHGRKKKIVARVIFVYLALFFAALAGELAGLHGLDNMSPVFYIALPVMQVFTIALTVMEAFRGNYYARGVLVPEVMLVVLVAFDGLNLYYNITSWRIPLMPAGIFGFVVFVFGILQAQVQKEKDMEVQSEHLQKEIAETNLKASTDPLTGCLNRTNFRQLMEDACRDAEAKQSPFSLVMFDIDHFKRFNDTYGHDDGDAVLRNFTACIREMISRKQPFIRYGGEEFIIILPGLGLREAAKLGEDIRLHVSDSKLHDKERVTSSVGVSTWHGNGDSAQDVLRRVDESLYLAKNHGRNRVMTEDML